MSRNKVVGTGGEVLMHQLVAQEVQYAFTNTGSAEAGFFDAFLPVPGVQPILLLAESLVLSAADGFAKAAGKPSFVNVHLAAGTRQGSGQLQNAYFDGTPMVVTAALRDNGSFGDHNTLGASAGFSQMSAVEDITKNRWEVTDARGVALATRRAFKEAMTMPTGPVYLAFLARPGPGRSRGDNPGRPGVGDGATAQWRHHGENPRCPTERGKSPGGGRTGRAQCGCNGRFAGYGRKLRPARGRGFL